MYISKNINIQIIKRIATYQYNSQNPTEIKKKKGKDPEKIHRKPE